MTHRPVAPRTSSFVRALHQAARADGHVLTVLGDHEKPWATATFAGVLHRVTLADDPALAAWLETLPRAELDVHGAVVVELIVEAPATIVALVVETDAKGT